MDRIEDTVDQEITSDTIASQVELERDSHAGAILIVEGDSDSLLLKALTDENLCKVVVANGKENALGAIDKLNKEGKKGVLCIVDADFHHIGVRPVENEDNLVVSEYHDLEIMLIESQAFDRIIREYGKPEKIARAESEFGMTIRNILYQSASFIGAFRLWSIESENYLTFKHVKDSDYKFISAKELDCDKTSLISSVKNASKKFSIKEVDVENFVNQILARGYDKRQLCNGHDMCGIIAKALRRIISSEDEAVACKNNVEKLLRVGFGRFEFSATALYSEIRKWQQVNEPYMVLPY